MKTQGNDPANPTVVGPYQALVPQVGEAQWQMPGTSKREHFAAMAMQGILAQNSAVSYTSTQIAIRAVEQADALIEALNKLK